VRGVWSFDYVLVDSNWTMLLNMHVQNRDYHDKDVRIGVIVKWRKAVKIEVRVRVGVR
jgi:hypothetical protein